MKVRFRFAIAIAVALAILGAAFAVSNLPPRPSSTTGPPPPPPAPKPSACPRSVGLCSVRNVTGVVDGDTLDVEPNLSIRLVLVNAPELDAAGGPEAKDHLVSLCLGTQALVDEDDNQIGGDPYGRVLAVVQCDGTNANADMISSGLAKTYYMFCSVSEFGNQSWTGCSSTPPSGSCDPAYPDVCIPSPPPDLDCKDIPYRRFSVLPPDPHHFDVDGDGIGCETG
jgi:micrococcal nuclease